MPAGKTYVKIASQTLGSASASVTFSNLPQNYTDLVAVIDGTATTSFGQIQMRFNGDTGSNYSTTYLWGTGSAAVSDRDSNISTGGSNPGFIGTGRGTTTINVQNYSNQSTYKTAIARSSVTGNRVSATANLWRSTAAVNAIRFNILGGDTFASTTTFTIYGIEAAKSPYAEGGDKVYSTGTHWVHEFYYSGTFVPRQNLTADYLVVAGGGGGGRNNGGGGGAGGLRCTVTATGGGGSLESALSLNGSQAYTVTVGAGGVGQIATSPLATAGSDSVFSTITSTGGGYGGGYNGSAYVNGGNGGSGGGAAGTTGLTGGTRQTGQGFAGGNGSNTDEAGGGGGAGAAGANGGSTSPGAGGNGVTTSISGVSTVYGGGGGGGQRTTAGSTGLLNNGGTGGGGSGAQGTTGTGFAGTAGTTNTGGGGGGGSRQDGNGANGGSGVVIVRYAV